MTVTIFPYYKKLAGFCVCVFLGVWGVLRVLQLQGAMGWRARITVTITICASRGRWPGPSTPVSIYIYIYFLIIYVFNICMHFTKNVSVRKLKRWATRYNVIKPFNGQPCLKL